MVTIKIDTCNSCPHCEHNGRLQAPSQIKLICHKGKSKVIGNAYNPGNTHYDPYITYKPPVWCPLRKGGK